MQLLMQSEKNLTEDGCFNIKTEQKLYLNLMISTSIIPSPCSWSCRAETCRE